MVTMSQKEFQRVKVIENAVGGRLSVREASRLLQLSERQVQRLKRRYQPDSLDWVQHGNRGRRRPWAVSVPQKQLILRLARSKYQGFNDSHLAEKLCAEENLTLSRETVRRILRAAKLASPQKRRARRYRCRRIPRPRFGMMVLTDASRHDWLEGRGPQLTLVGFQDDATSQILAAQFQLEPENTVGYLRALHAMITAHGIPLSLTVIVTTSFSATMRIGRRPRNFPENKLLRISVELSKNWASSKSPPIHRKRKAASSGPGELVRIVWSANCAWHRPAPCRKPMLCCSASAPITIYVSRTPPLTALAIFVLCHDALIWLAA
jgi:transposase